MTALTELAGITRLEHARAAAFSADATIEDVAQLLGMLGQASLDDLATRDDKDLQRAMALGALQGIATCLAQSLRHFDADTRCAPPAELAEVLKDARQDCANAHQGCFEYVLPWIYNGRHCSPTCEVADGRTRP